MTKGLIAYYSREGENYVSGSIIDLPVGNTEIAVGMISELTAMDAFKIEQKDKYSPDYTICTEQARHDLHTNARPALARLPRDIDAYDMIILAYPNYWGTMPMAVYTFLEAFDFRGKTILPLCTHEGSGLGHSEADLKRLCPTATVRAGLALKGGSVKSARPQIENWLRQFKLSQ